MDPISEQPYFFQSPSSLIFPSLFGQKNSWPATGFTRSFLGNPGDFNTFTNAWQKGKGLKA